ncbi:MAG TPA: hypothetical protein DD473_02150 [Planctomycetaceae bacterium]|nr:hypothetical protein [Planctomycetaceae bacterium]
MISLAKILVGVDLSHADRLISHDLSDQCEQAVKKAIELAKAGGGELTFFAAIDISEQALHLIETDDDSGKKSTVEVEAEEVLGQFVARASEAGVKADFSIAFGASWEKTIQEVLKNNHTLVVIGRKSKTTISNFFFGRTAVKLLRKCPVPVYVAKPDPVRPVESILVADDFAEIGEDLLDAGVQFAKALDTRLHVVHVVESGDDYKLAGSGIAREDLDKLHNEELEQANTIAADRLSRTDARTIPQGTMVHIEKGTAENVIGKLLREHEIDLLIMGTNGRTGFSAMMMGNTAERVLADLDCSLLAIKPRDFRCSVKA